MSDAEALPDHVRRNRAAWDAWAAGYVANAERSWGLAPGEETWGIWSIPEAQVGLIPADIAGQDVIELGCGTAYVSAWLARRGARPVGIDNSARQLETARRMQRQHGLEFPLIHGNAETVPLPDASFDFAISEYGAAIWADPYRWIPEAARLLRPGGRLRFLGNATIFMLFAAELDNVPAGTQLMRPYFGMYRFEWPDDDSVEFHLPYGEWIRLFRRSGFEIEDLVELQAPEGARSGYRLATPEWAHQWPTEEVWFLRKQA